MDRTARRNELVLLICLVLLVGRLPLPFPLQLCVFIAVPLRLLGVRRGGKTLLIVSPLLVSWISLAYLPVSERAVGAFVIAYILGLFIVGVVGYVKLNMSVWRFLMETRARLRDLNSRAVASQPVLGPASPAEKRPWAERLARRVLGVS